MRVLPPKRLNCSVKAFVGATRPSTHIRGAAVLRAELPTASALQVHAHDAEAEFASEPERVSAANHAEEAQALGHEATSSDRPPRDVTEVSASGHHGVDSNDQRKIMRRKKPLERSKFRCKVGDIVVGRVMLVNYKGAWIDLLDYPDVSGFMPANRGPFAVRHVSASNPFWDSIADCGCITVGTIRKFQVIAIPPVMEVNGRGPLLAANNLDISLLWRRLDQIFEVCRSMREMVKVRIHGVNSSGLLCSFSGIRGFIPISHIPKPSENSWWEPATLEAEYVGKIIEVWPLLVNRKRNTFTCSIRQALATRALVCLHIGSLVWGTVRLVRSYGAFVAIDDTTESALLHIGNISCERVYDVEEHFTVGDRVRAVIIGMDADYSRISISTKDLEITPGDMLINKKTVFDNAEEGVKPFLQHVADWEAQNATKQSEQDWHDGSPDVMEGDDFTR